MSATVLGFPDPSIERQKRVSDHVPLVRPIARSIYRHLFPPIQFDDLVGVGLLALIQSCDTFSTLPLATFELYVRLSIRRAILDSVRHQISRRESFCVLDRGHATKRAAESSAAGAVDLRRAIQSLPERERRVIELRLEGRTQEEVGKELGLTQRGAGKLEARAIESLRARMNPALAKAA